MSGHSKWTQIKRKKAVQDQRRGKVFSKLLRAIEVAAREGSGNPEGNPALGSAIEQARAADVPIDNIERALKRGTGEIEGVSYEPVVYEGYAPGGVAVLVQALTDNRNRTSQEVRHAFTRTGGNLGDPGSVAWMFDRRGVVLVDRDAAPDEDRLLELAVEAGADDLRLEGDQWQVTSDPASVDGVRAALEAAGIAFASAEVTMLPKTTLALDGDQARKVLALLETLDDLDDVQAVYSNFDIPDEVLAEAG